MRSPRSLPHSRWLQRSGDSNRHGRPAPVLLPPQQLSRPGADARCSVAGNCAITGARKRCTPSSIRPASAGPSAETETEDRGMDDKALEELCKWHDEQAAMLRARPETWLRPPSRPTCTPDLRRASRSRGRDQAAAIGGGTERVRSACQDVRSQHQQHSGADLLVAGGGSGRIPGLVDSRDAGLAISRADPQAIWLLCWNRSPRHAGSNEFGFAASRPCSPAKRDQNLHAVAVSPGEGAHTGTHPRPGA